MLALVPVVALGAVLAHVLDDDVQQRYLDSARQSATLISVVGIQPLLNGQELSGGLTAPEIAGIDDRLRGASVSADVRRIKVWNKAGTIVYSDNPALVGRTFAIDDDLGDALRGTASASVTDGHDEENSGDNLAGPLVQAYVPLVFSGSSKPSGAFEIYLPYAPVQAAIDQETNRLYVVLALGLLAFYAAIVGVAVLADRWRRRLIHEAETTALANLAVLERLNRLKSEFLTRVGHQFRTALVGIQGFSEVIKDSEELDLSEVKGYAVDIYNDATRLDRAFGDLLELDRMQTGRVALQTSRVGIDHLVQRVADRVHTENGQHPIAIHLNAPDELVPCDPERVTQALGNVVSNAIKFSPTGSEVTISTELAGDAVVIHVTDHGRGMPHDFGDGMLTGYEHATGLGLPIARQIMEMHGGRIWFDSIAGAGTTFHLSLPLKLRQSRGIAKAVAAAPA